MSSSAGRFTKSWYAHALPALGLALASTAVWAAEPTEAQVRLETKACPGVAAARLQDLIALEISTVGAGRTRCPAIVVLACDGDRIAISATEVQTGNESHSEVLTRGTAGPALLRLLAISISELLVTNELPPAPRPPVVREEKPLPKPEPARWLRASAATSIRRVARPATWLGGVGLGAEFLFAPRFTLAIEGRGEFGATASSLSAVDWRVAGASVALRAGTDLGVWRIEAGPGVEGGLVQLSAHDTATGAKGSTLSNPWFGLMGTLRVIRTLGSRAFLSGQIYGGWIMQRVAGVTSDGSSLVELRDGWTGISLGAGLQL